MMVTCQVCGKHFARFKVLTVDGIFQMCIYCYRVATNPHKNHPVVGWCGNPNHTHGRTGREDVTLLEEIPYGNV